ncbi:hypothetical protein YC2023_105529 [Brassica napus]
MNIWPCDGFFNKFKLDTKILILLVIRRVVRIMHQVVNLLSKIHIDYSGLSLITLEGYGFVSNLHNTAECSGQYSDIVDMEAGSVQPDYLLGFSWSSLEIRKPPDLYLYRPDLKPRFKFDTLNFRLNMTITPHVVHIMLMKNQAELSQLTS